MTFMASWFGSFSLVASCKWDQGGMVSWMVRGGGSELVEVMGDA